LNADTAEQISQLIPALHKLYISSERQHDTYLHLNLNTYTASDTTTCLHYNRKNKTVEHPAITAWLTTTPEGLLGRTAKAWPIHDAYGASWSRLGWIASHPRNWEWERDRERKRLIPQASWAQHQALAAPDVPFSASSTPQLCSLELTLDSMADCSITQTAPLPNCNFTIKYQHRDSNYELTCCLAHSRVILTLDILQHFSTKQVLSVFHQSKFW